MYIKQINLDKIDLLVHFLYVSLQLKLLLNPELPYLLPLIYIYIYDDEKNNRI